MELSSIARAARAAASTLQTASDKLSVITKSTSKTDTPISDVWRQADQLTRLLKLLATALDNPRLEKYAGSDNQDLWDHVARAVRACNVTCYKLRAQLDILDAEGSSSANHAWHHLKANWGAEKLERLSTDLKTHSLNIELALGIVNILASNDAPHDIAQDRVSWIARLERMIAAVDQRLERRDSNAQNLPKDQVSNTTSLNENTERLRLSASSVMSGISSVSNVRNSGSNAGLSGSVNRPPLENLDTVDEIHLSERANTIAESEFIVPLPQFQRLEINNWMGSSSAQRNVDEDVVSLPPAHAQSVPPTSTVGDAESWPGGAAHNVHDDSSDDDDDLDLRVAESILSKANAKFDSGDIPAAEKLLGSALDHSESLSSRSKESLRLNDVQLKYALCCLNQGHLDKAKASFEAVLGYPVKTASDADISFHALHGLAEVCLWNRDAEAAYNHCRQALKGRGKSKTVGKLHKDYFASMRLLALTLWAKGDKVRAEAYANLLPSQDQLTESDFDRVLGDEFGWLQNIPATDHLSPPEHMTWGGRTPDSWTKGSESSFEYFDYGAYGQEVSRNGSQEHLLPRPYANSSLGAGKNVIAPKAAMQTPPEVPVKDSIKPRRFTEPARPTATSPTTTTPPAYSRQDDASEKIVVDSTDSERFSFDRTPLEPTSPRSVRSASYSAVYSSIYNDVQVALHLLRDRSQSKHKKVKKALFSASEKGDLQALDLLLSNGADPNIQDGWSGLGRGETPLHRAAMADHAEACRLLLKAGASVTAVDFGGATALDRAIGRGRIRICDVLVKHGARPPGLAKKALWLTWVITKGELDGCRYLLSSNANIEARTRSKSLDTTNNQMLDRSTPLIDAAERRDRESCRFFLDAGVDVNERDSQGYTALMYSAEHGSHEICELLLGNGALTEPVNNKGENALHLAKSPEIRQLLENTNSHRRRVT